MYCESVPGALVRSCMPRLVGLDPQSFKVDGLFPLPLNIPSICFGIEPLQNSCKYFPNVGEEQNIDGNALAGINHHSNFTPFATGNNRSTITNHCYNTVVFNRKYHSD